MFVLPVTQKSTGFVFLSVLRTVTIMGLESVFVILAIMMIMASVKQGNPVPLTVRETIKECVFVMLGTRCMMVIVLVVRMDKFGYQLNTDVLSLAV